MRFADGFRQVDRSACLRGREERRPQRRTVAPVRWDLATLTAAAACERPDARIAIGQIEAAEAGERTAVEWPNPVLSLSANYYTALFEPSPWEVGPSISQLIQTARKRPAEIRQHARLRFKM